MSGDLSGTVRSVEIRGRSFDIAADADGTRDLGGDTIELAPTSLGAIKKATRKPWKLEGLSLVINDLRGDQEFLNRIASGTEPGADIDGWYPISFTFASGLTYGGRGSVVGDVAKSSMNGTASVNFGGPGRLERQA